MKPKFPFQLLNDVNDEDLIALAEHFERVRKVRRALLFIAFVLAAAVLVWSMRAHADDGATQCPSVGYCDVPQVELNRLRASNEQMLRDFDADQQRANDNFAHQLEQEQRDRDLDARFKALEDEMERAR